MMQENDRTVHSPGVTTWLRAMRLPFLTATIVPVLLGGAIAYYQGVPFRGFEFALTLVGLACIHLGLNLGNDYFDHTSGNDEGNLTPTPFSGGSRVIQEKLIPPRAILCASLFFFALGGGIGMVLNHLTPGNVILYVGLAGSAIAYLYTASPVRIGYIGGLGEPVCGLGFGPLAVLGAYFVQAHRFDLAPAILSIPVGVLIAEVLLINEFPDFDADGKVKKRTLVVLLGKKRSVAVYVALLAVPYAVVVAAIAANLAPVHTLVTWLTLPLAVYAGKVALKQYDRIQELLPANKSTIALHLSFGLLLSGGCLGARILGS
ncbi:MAG: 1,4-dihydroxy-2-naphthoate octaprenyltransferase [Planctomycetota bacterium]|nr:1,4-dihydroxy-2-naphthoate octaprenyltransferase [Planctomycetota bacterium]